MYGFVSKEMDFEKVSGERKSSGGFWFIGFCNGLFKSVFPMMVRE